MLTIIRKSAAGVAAVAVLGLGGAAMADAARKSSSATRSSSTSAEQARPSHEALSSDVASKAKAAALEKVPGATVDRVEGSGPYSTKYHAHITTSGGTKQIVLIDDSFTATAVQADNGRGGHGGRGHGGPGSGEKALTGDTKAKVEDAVLAKYAGATIERTETNGDSAAPYESHITTSAGKELEVLVSKDFAVVDARERTGRP